jgi:NADPH2:quinone reductase
MKAAYLEETGSVDQIRYGEFPRPNAEPHQVLVRVGAVAVNPIDTYIRGGANYFPLPMPYIVGCDLAGTIEATGADVKQFSVGDRVWGSNQGIFGRQGSFAEYAAVDECWLYPTPATVSDEDAAAGALVGITAHLGLFLRGQLKENEILMVNGGSGGVGSMVIQMAKATGARVIATAGSEEKLAACRQSGADLAIDYNAENLEEQVREFAPEGVDIYWEISREPDLDRGIGLLANWGRMILMAGREAKPSFPVGPFYSKSCSLLGLVLFAVSAEQQRASAVDINRFLESGQLRPRIDRVLPMAETLAAHRLQEQATIHGSGELFGKIVLEP